MTGARRLVFLGPPGVGKGTQAARLSARLGVAHIATGDMLRNAVAQGSATGQQARRYMDQGALVPDEVILDLVDERLRAPDTAAGFLFDGFPRTLPQAKALDLRLAQSGKSLERVLFLAAPDEVIVERLSGRRTCRGCQTTFHVRFAPPSEAGVCDQCQGELYQRADDHESAIRRRLEAYRADTEPLAAFYRGGGRLAEIDGAGGIEDIERALTRALGLQGAHHE